MRKRKEFKGLRACHSLDVSNTILERLEVLEDSDEIVTEVQEMTLLLLTEIMFNTAVLVDLSIDDSDERGTNDHKGNKQDDRRTS